MGAPGDAGHWINTDDAGSFQMMDDGERTCKLIGLIGSAIMTMLDTLDRENELKANGTIKDLGLVISLYLKFVDDQEDYGIEEEELEWRPLLITYAEKAGIDLAAVGCSSTAQSLEDVEAGSPDELKGVDKRFNWTKTVSDPTSTTESVELTEIVCRFESIRSTTAPATSSVAKNSTS